jgi:hypothetical protein
MPPDGFDTHNNSMFEEEERMEKLEHAIILTFKK